LGASRCGAAAGAAMLEEYKRRAESEKAGTIPKASRAKLGTGGY
jgi:hypothetical protein